MPIQPLRWPAGAATAYAIHESTTVRLRNKRWRYLSPSRSTAQPVFFRSVSLPCVRQLLSPLLSHSLTLSPTSTAVSLQNSSAAHKYRARLRAHFFGAKSCPTSPIQPPHHSPYAYRRVCPGSRVPLPPPPPRTLAHSHTHQDACMANFAGHCPLVHLPAR